MWNFRRALGPGAALGLLSSLLIAPTTIAQAITDGQWSFGGTLTAPARSLSTETVSANGTITITQGVLDLAACADPVATPPEVVPHLRNVASGSMVAFTSGGVVITGLSPVALAASTTVSPGAYELVLRYRCNGGSFTGHVASTPSVSVSIASEVGSPTYLTLACITTVPPMACTTQLPQASSLPSGYNVTFAGIIRRTWSDGVITEDPVTGSQRLEYRPVGLVTFSTLSTSCATTTQITQSREYRCVVGSSPLNTVRVDVLTATNEFVLGPTRVQPQAAPVGSDIVVSGSVSQYYSDRSLWPAVTGTEYRIEFQPSGSSSWGRIGPTFRLGVAGNIGATIEMPGTGRIRVVVGNYASTPAEIIELKALDEYQISVSRPPGSVNPGDEITMSGSVKQKWSDGPFRDVESGTTVVFEYSEAYDPATSDRRWEQVTSARTVNAVYRVSAVPQASGFWRVRVGNAATTEVFVRVNGSEPITMQAQVLPSVGTVPFVGTDSRFSISVNMEGYVGTEPLEVWARIGDGTPARVGQISAGQNFGGFHVVPVPTAPGNYRPVVELRSSRGRILSSFVGSEFMVDGVVEYLAALSGPNRTLISGETTQLQAGLQEVLFSGDVRSRSWWGTAQLQVNRGNGWQPVTRWVRARGSVVRFKAAVYQDAEYRVVGRGPEISGDPTEFSFPTKDASVQVKWPSRVSKSKGLKVRVTVQSGDAQRWRGRAQVYLEFRAARENRWRFEDRTTYRGTKAVRLSTGTVAAGCYRVRVVGIDLEDRAGYGVRSCTR